MQEQIKKIRLEIVASGLNAAVQFPNRPLTRKEFFIMDKNEAGLDKKRIDLIIKANNSKTWQAGVVDRLIKFGLLRKTQYKDGIGYTVENEVLVKQTVDNFKHGDGLIISHFVFPNEVAPPSGFLEKEESQLPNPPEVTSDLVEIDESELLSNLYKATVKVRAAQAEFSEIMSAATSAILASNSELLEIIKKQNSIFKMIGEGITQTGKDVETVGNKVNGLRKDVDELSKASKDCKSVVDSNQKSTKDLLQSISGINNASAKIENVSASMQEISEVVRAVDLLTKEIRSREANKINNIGTQITDAVKNLAALSHEMLNVTAEIGSP